MTAYWAAPGPHQILEIERLLSISRVSAEDAAASADRTTDANSAEESSGGTPSGPGSAGQTPAAPEMEAVVSGI